MRATAYGLIGVLAVLLALVGPAAATYTGTVTWNESSYQFGATGAYSWTSNGSVCNLSIYAPTGVRVYNSASLGASGAGTYSLTTAGTWTTYLYNGTTLLDSDTTSVGYWESITSVVTGFANNVIPAFVSFVTSVVPLVVIIAIIGFVLIFIRRILEWIRL